MKRNYIVLSLVTTAAAIFTCDSLVFVNVFESQIVEEVCGYSCVH